MDYLPIFIDLKGRGCLVVGGGVQAAAKVALLRSAGARVTVLAETLCPELARTLDKGEVLHLARQFRAEDLDGASLVIAATGNARRNRAVARAAAARDIAVNVVDDAQASSFIMPAIIDRSPVVIAVSSGGAAPALTRLLKTRIEGLVPAAYGGLASLAASFRGAVKALIPEAAARRRFWRRALEGTVADAALSGDGAKARERMIALLNAPLPPHDIAGRVAIVGAGPGDPELLTLRALRLVQAADVLVFDRLVGDRVLDYARRDAERIDVGKTKGDAATAQADIDALLVSLVRAGKRVVRLKGGDPFIFGRGGEEIAALASAGIEAEVVPGITAALGCAAYAGIPLTHRDHAHSCVFVSGHGKGGALDLDWPTLARAGQTVVVYMGLSSIGPLARQLIGHGRDPRTPAAIIDNGTLPQQQVVVTTLEDLGASAREAELGGPAILIIGEVVALHDAASARHFSTAEPIPAAGAAG